MESDAAMAEASGAHPVPSLVYYEKTLKFPKDLKNDIIYCQRALKTHIRVHQKIVEVFQKQNNADPVEMKNVLNEIESEIFEINAEQNYLFLRLRRIVHEHNKTLKALKMTIDPCTTNMIITKEVMPFINDESQHFYPSSVQTRTNEANLMHKYYKYFHKTEPKIYEISDSDDEAQPNPINKHSLKPDNQLNGQVPAQFTKHLNGHSGHVRRAPPPQPAPQQTSLLKPIAQRMVSTGTTYADVMQFLQIDMKEENMHVEPAVQEPPELPVSKNVTRSRLNLRQALKRARTETLGKTPSTAEDKKPIVTFATPTTIAAQPQPTIKKYETRTKATRNTTAPKSPELNSSSENSNPEIERFSPPQSISPLEAVEYKTKPEDYLKEEFLALMGLYTTAAISLMQQRRSKRTRRTVHSNERADFHYGRIDYANLDAPEENKKKRKEFLLSPQVKRNLQTKRAKIDRAPSRSSSSSPEEKRACNECLKGGGCCDQCSECKGFYHQQCHREDDDQKPNSVRRALAIPKPNLCPACKRAEQNLLLKGTTIKLH